MRRYTQLTREQRHEIYALMKAGHNQPEIAMLVGCNKSTISRELGRNRGLRGRSTIPERDDQSEFPVADS